MFSLFKNSAILTKPLNKLPESKLGEGLFKNLTNKPVFQVANLKTLALRMKSIGSIKKITKAMQMVAAAKMKQEVGRLDRGKEFGVGAVQRLMDNQTYLQKKKQTPTIKKSLMVPFTSDRGLCGGVNSSIVRFIKAELKENRGAYKLVIIGDKGTAGLIRPFPDLIFASINQIAIPMNFPTASSIAHQVSEMATDCDNILIVYNEFKNVITQIIRKVELMTRANFLKNFQYVSRHDASEPEKDYAQHYFYEFYLASMFYHAFLNSIASEQSSRMNAMQNASKNAGEILQKLTQDYNKARQAKITVELCEIISGAAAAGV